MMWEGYGLVISNKTTNITLKSQDTEVKDSKCCTSQSLEGFISIKWQSLQTIKLKQIKFMSIVWD